MSRLPRALRQAPVPEGPAEGAVALWDAWQAAGGGERFVVWTDGPRVCLDAAHGPLEALVVVRVELRTGDGPPG